MLLAKYTSSTKTGRKIRKPTISSEFGKILFKTLSAKILYINIFVMMINPDPEML